MMVLQTMLTMYPAVNLSTGELLIASEIALKEILSIAPSMSRKVLKTYPLKGYVLSTFLDIIGYSAYDCVYYFM